jgi:hypothetical protein
VFAPSNSFSSVPGKSSTLPVTRVSRETIRPARYQPASSAMASGYRLA